MKIRHAAPLAVFAALILSGCGDTEESNAKSTNYPELPVGFEPIVKHGMEVVPATGEHSSITQSGNEVRCSDGTETIQILGGNPMSTGEFGTSTLTDGSINVLFGTPRRGETAIVNGEQWGLVPQAADGADFAFLLPDSWRKGKLITVVICRMGNLA